MPLRVKIKTWAKGLTILFEFWKIPVTVSFEDTDDYICIRDMAAAK